MREQEKLLSSSRVDCQRQRTHSTVEEVGVKGDAVMVVNQERCQESHTQAEHEENRAPRLQH